MPLAPSPQVVTTRNVSMYCQMPLRMSNIPWLRNSALEKWQNQDRLHCLGKPQWTVIHLKVTGWKSQATKSEPSIMDLYSKPGVASTGCITCGPCGDTHSQLSNFLWDTERPDSLCSLIETWKGSQNYFHTEITLNRKLGNTSSFHPCCTMSSNGFW